MYAPQLAGQNREYFAACISLQYALSPVLLSFWLSAFVHFAG